MNRVTVGKKGRVTLPKRLRDRLGILPGTQLRFVVEADGRLCLQVLSKGAEGLFGLLAKAGEPVGSLQEMDEAVSRSVRSRAGRPVEP
jgi:antitoxin PrlF